MREYGLSLTRILPYSRIFYAVNDENINLRFQKWHLFFKGEKECMRTKRTFTVTPLVVFQFRLFLKFILSNNFIT